MRLRDILFIVNESLPILKNIKFINSVNNGYKIENINNIYIHFDKLKEIDALKNDIELLLEKHAFLISKQDFMHINRDVYDDCKNMLDKIKNKCSLIISLLKQIVQHQDKNTISFKLYKFENFNEFSIFCDDLNKKILFPLQRLNIDIHLGELETGSKWISIVCATGMGVMLLTAIVRQSFDILIYDYQKFKVAKSVTETIEMGNEFINEYNKKVIEKLDIMKYDKAEQIIMEIKNENGFPLENEGDLSELRTAIKFSIDFMEKHIDKGLEVYHVLDKPEDERYKLPDFTKLIELKQPQKLITDNTEDIIEEENIKPITITGEQ